MTDTNHYQTTLALDALRALVDGLSAAGAGRVVRFAGTLTPHSTRLRLVLTRDDDVRQIAAAVGLTPSRTTAGVFRAYGPWLGGTLALSSAQKSS